MYISNVLFMRIIWKYKDFFIIFALYMSRYKSITLLGAYDQDLERFLHRVGKDRSERSLRAMKQGRQYVAAFLQDWMQVGDIDLPVASSSGTPSVSSTFLRTFVRGNI